MEKFLEKYGFYALLAVGLVCAVSILWPLFSFVPEKDKQLEITFIDVGQADSALVICPDGTAALVDAGADMRSGTPEDGVEKNVRIILSLLDQKGVSRLDSVFISHTDLDHIGALGPVMEKIPVGRIIAAEPDRKTIDKYLSGHAGTVPYFFAGAGDTFELGDKVFVDCLFPDKQRIDLSASPNSRSLVCRLNYEMFSVLFTGDIGSETMSFLVRRGWERKPAVLKFPHHGAFCPGLENFVSGVFPQFSVISCGRSNRYGHPDEKTLGILGRRKFVWARTDRNGNITVRSSGWGFSVEPQRQSLRVAGVPEPSLTGT